MLRRLFFWLCYKIEPYRWWKKNLRMVSNDSIVEGQYFFRIGFKTNELHASQKTCKELFSIMQEDGRYVLQENKE